MSIEYLDQIVQFHKQGRIAGIPSICSAHPWVLQAVMRRAASSGLPVLIESTCNQVNQFGGYTGMLPKDFIQYVNQVAQQVGLPAAQLILGGDHLGPSVWQDEPAEAAMEKATNLVVAYVLAGYRKIHLDASMRLGGDSPGPIDVELSAERTATLALAAERAYQQVARTDRSLNPPRYVIGTEVPIPGGALSHESHLAITTPEMAQQTIDLTRQAFEKAGLELAWKRVIALVVQPGAEYGDDHIFDYDPEAARNLSHRIENYQNLIYEAHSTDYQNRDSLCNLVRDHFGILKVGPGLTFSFREAVFGLAAIENELIPGESCSQLVKVLDDVMLCQPDHWLNYYHGNPEQLRLARKYSFSDRSRYYWSQPLLLAALDTLLQNLHSVEIPLTLLSQYLPEQYTAIRCGTLVNDPSQIILDHIGTVLANYEEACKWHL